MCIQALMLFYPKSEGPTIGRQSPKKLFETFQSFPKHTRYFLGLLPMLFDVLLISNSLSPCILLTCIVHRNHPGSDPLCLAATMAGQASSGISQRIYAHEQHSQHLFFPGIRMF